MAEDLDLCGLAKRTHVGYLRAVRQLADYCQTPPEKITEAQFRDYFLMLKNKKKFSYGSLRVAFSGIKFFYTKTCKRKWKSLEQFKLQNVKALPVVMTIKEVHSIIARCSTLRMKVFFWTTYSLGLRLEEALNLHVGDIDSQRMMVHVHRGKGAKDRYVQLSLSTLRILRLYWATHRNKTLIFPSGGRKHEKTETAVTVMSRSTVQTAIEKIVQSLGFTKRISTHTLRHSCATHILFEVSSQAIIAVANATKSLRDVKLGFFGVLHTWGRDPLVHHPHIHYIVAGGGVSKDQECWVASPKNFFVHHDTLVRVFKGKLADKLRELGIYDEVPTEAWDAKWVVDLKPIGDGTATVKYLAPYVYRVAISNNRIEYCDDVRVVYRYTPSGTRVSKKREVEGRDFVGGFLQHVLPSGFQKIRYFVWMSPNCRVSLDKVRWLIWLYRGWTYWLASGYAPQVERAPQASVTCPRCGHAMTLTRVIYQECSLLVNWSTHQKQSYKNTG